MLVGTARAVRTSKMPSVWGTVLAMRAATRSTVRRAVMSTRAMRTWATVRTATSSSSKATAAVSAMSMATLAIGARARWTLTIVIVIVVVVVAPLAILLTVVLVMGSVLVVVRRAVWVSWGKWWWRRTTMRQASRAAEELISP